MIYKKSNKIGPIKGNKDRTTSIIYSNWVAGDGLGARGGSKLSIIAVSWLCGKEVIVERTADLIVVRYKKWQVLCRYYRACALVLNRRKTDSDTSVKTNLVSRVLMVGPDPFCYYLVRSLELICRPGIDSLCGSFRFMVRRILRPRNKCAGWLFLLDVWLRLCMSFRLPRNPLCMHAASVVFRSCLGTMRSCEISRLLVRIGRLFLRS